MSEAAATSTHPDLAHFQDVLATNPNFVTVFHEGSTTLLELRTGPSTGT